jgi:hypothetical protein
MVLRTGQRPPGQGLCAPWELRTIRRGGAGCKFAMHDQNRVVKCVCERDGASDNRRIGEVKRIESP